MAPSDNILATGRNISNSLGEHLRARHGDAPRGRHLEGAGGAARRQGGQDGARQVLQALQVGSTALRPRRTTTDVKDSPFCYVTAPGITTRWR